MKNIIKQISHIVYSFLYYMREDINHGRINGLVLVGLINFLPDFHFLSMLRSILWRLAGVKIADITTTCIRSKNYIEIPSRLSVGRHFLLNRNCYLDSNGGIYIGDHVWISVNVTVLTTSHRGVWHEKDILKEVRINSYSLIYANAVILPGTVIEEGVIVGPGSVISGKTLPWSIYSGNPAVYVKERELKRTCSG